jgi:hypothetical protein
MRYLAMVIAAVVVVGLGNSTNIRADEPCGTSGEPGRHKPLRDWLHYRNQPCGCWATHDDLGCGSLKAECVFIFGSCRAFYGQPCWKGPPPSARELYEQNAREWNMP